MTNVTKPPTYFIGWDVGGWNCDKNPKSRDAVVILDSDLAVVSKPWRGNLRKHINEAAGTDSWIRELFSLCAADQPDNPVQATIAIDTPLGFSEAFVRLVTDLKGAAAVENSATNPYLFRQTERRLFSPGLTPLSAIKDMIGSQATKGMHVLARFAPDIQSCGVWTGGPKLTAIEAYPSACKGSATIRNLRRPYPPLGHADKEDALTCALIAFLFSKRREVLAGPADSVPSSEGWIWIPRDAFEREGA